MRDIFRIACTILLMIFFLTSQLQTGSAELFGSSDDWFEKVEHKWVMEECKFYDEQIDINYDFSKMKRIFIPDADISAIVMPSGMKMSERDKRELEVSIKSYVKKMKCKSVNKKLADAVLEIKIKEWKSEFHHREPEKIVYEAYEYYEGWKKVNDPFHHRPPPPRDGKHKPDSRHRPPPPQPPRKEWTVSRNWFPGSRRVVSPHYRFEANKITSSEPFTNSKKVVYPAHDVYLSEVTALFEVRDSKTDATIISREGTVNSLKQNYQLKLYTGLCHAFCKDFRKVVKQAKNLKSKK